MARRSTIFDDISKLPWQVGIVLAVLCYPAAILLESYFASNQILAGLGVAVSTIWPIFSALFLLAAFFSFINGRNKSSIFKSHRSIEKIRSLTWQQFEQFVGSYFKDQGYSVMETAAGPKGSKSWKSILGLFKISGVPWYKKGIVIQKDYYSSNYRHELTNHT